MKILHVIGQRPEKTGSGVYLQAVIKESFKNGYDNYLLAGVPVDEEPDLSVIQKANCLFVYFDNKQLPFPVTGMSDVMPYKSSLFRNLKGNHLEYYKAIFKEKITDAVKRFNPDIIHTHHLFLVTAIARQAIPDIPMVTTCHSTELRQFLNCPHLRDFVRQQCGKLDHIMALSKDQKNEIVDILDINKDKITVTGGGYDHELFNKKRKPTPPPVNILYAGKLNKPKGVPVLLKALIRLKHSTWHLHMAGSGTGKEYKECLNLAEKLGDRVTVHGQVSHEQLSELMKKSHIQVLPSYFEGLPLVLFEGLASGCRLITYNLSGFHETFGTINPEFVKLIALPPMETIDSPYEKDAEKIEIKLTEAIDRMIKRVREVPVFYDPEANRVASEFTWENVFKKISSTYTFSCH